MSGSGTTDAPSRQWCATMQVHERLVAEDPAYARARSELESQARAFREGRRTARTGVVDIPVVVHVVWNTDPRNVSAEQVHSQVTVLNQDFRRLNPDVTATPAVWQHLVGDARVQFHLATEDPDGKPSDGITRRQTSVTAFPPDDSVKAAANGVEAWPTDRYLNLWVCPLAGGLLGYAQFPGGPAATDGVVVDTEAFGTTGTATPPFHLGRTATHEVGHWLNLFHIWGDDGSRCDGTDQVDDTPNQGGFNVGMPTFPHVTCDNGPNGDMFVNYMDYTDDAGMVMFTAGQVERMQACLMGPHSSFLPVAEPGPVADYAVAWGADRLDVVGVGTDAAAYHAAWDGQAWSGWGSLGGIVTSDPVVASWGPGRLDAFVLGTDSGLWHRGWDGSQWLPLGAWEGLGGRFVHRPAVAWGPDRLDIFGIGTDGAMYHRAWDGTSWVPGGWERLGGIFTSPPTAVAWGPDRLDVFGLGTDNALYHRAWDGSSWVPGGWERLGGIFTSPPTAVAWGPNRLDVFGLGTDNALYHRAWDGSRWSPGNGAWERLGGTFTRP